MKTPKTRSQLVPRESLDHVIPPHDSWASRPLVAARTVSPPHCPPGYTGAGRADNGRHCLPHRQGEGPGFLKTRLGQMKAPLPLPHGA